MQDMDYYFSHFPVLETERLILRAKTATDAEDMKTYMADESFFSDALLTTAKRII